MVGRASGDLREQPGGRGHRAGSGADHVARGRHLRAPTGHWYVPVGRRGCARSGADDLGRWRAGGRSSARGSPGWHRGLAGGAPAGHAHEANRPKVVPGGNSRRRRSGPVLQRRTTDRVSPTAHGPEDPDGQRVADQPRYRYATSRERSSLAGIICPSLRTGQRLHARLADQRRHHLGQPGAQPLPTGCAGVPGAPPPAVVVGRLLHRRRSSGLARDEFGGLRDPRSATSRGGMAGTLSTPEERMQVVADEMAVTDVVLRFFELVDSKDWEHMHEVLTEDTTVRRAPGTLTESRSDIVAAMQHMVGSDEIVTYHHVTS